MTLARRALLFLLATTTVASAQSPAAESLFREGRALLEQGKLQEGCDKLEASELVEPSVGTLLNIGDCRERLGKIATAWAAFRKAEALAKQSGKDARRLAEARRRARRLEPQLPSLTIQVAGPAPGIIVKRNGERVEGAVLGTDIPVDPGNYRITAEAPGYKPWQLDISLPVRGKRQITIPALERDQPAVVAATKPPPEPVPPIDIAPPARAEAPARVTVDERPIERPIAVHHDSTWTTSREAAVAIGVLGAISFGGAAYYGLHSSDLESRSDKVCPTSTCGSSIGLHLNDQAQSSATRANVMFVVGGAAVATATVLWLVGAPDEHSTITPAIGPGDFGAALAGRF